MDTIAERRMELRIEGRVVEVVARLGRPEPDTPHDSWKCLYEIAFGDASRTTATYGGDSLQALQLAMVTLNGELGHEAKSRGGVLYHLDEPYSALFEDSGMQVRPIDKASQ